jgi:hypothetical protein
MEIDPSAYLALSIAATFTVYGIGIYFLICTVYIYYRIDRCVYIRKETQDDITTNKEEEEEEDDDDYNQYMKKSGKEWCNTKQIGIEPL